LIYIKSAGVDIMRTRPWHVFGLAAIALPALWLLLAGPRQVLGIDAGPLGMVLLVTAAWTSLLALSLLPRGEAERALAPGEWKAWIGAGFMALGMGYFLGNADVFAAGGAGDAAPRRVATHLVLLLVAWAVLSQVLAWRWKGAVEEDERDRDIAVRAAAWGRGALMFCIVGIAVMLGFSPTHELRWASHFMIANLLIFALMWGWLVECAATAAMYWRDRQ
jgi:hypothetical protein